MCDNCNQEQEQESCIPDPIIQQNTDDVFFGICSDDTLPNLNLQAGTDLTSILKKIDYKLGASLNTVNFNSFNLAYLSGKYPVETIKKFSEAVSLELAYDNTRIGQLTTVIGQQGISIGGLSNTVEDIRLPEIIDSAGVGFTVNDDINTVLQKVVDKFTTLSSGGGSNLTLSSIDTNSIDITLSGVNNSTIKAAVKVSNAPNNKVQILSDGVYVANTPGNANQTLSVNGNQLSISGGNTVNIPVSGLQTLQLVGNNLTIAGGNTVTLPVTTESALITNNSNSIAFSQSGATGHTIAASTKISSVTGNKLVINSDGLYVQMSATDVLNQIAVDNSLKSTLCSIVANCSTSVCYKWFIQNLSSSPATVSYVDINDVSQTTTIAGSSNGSISGSKILTNPSSNLVITFQGKC